ncbi:rhomboid family intramembrane serine protease [Prauserella oleivorans]|uniref:Rhomboid family intramembrane serine protease n=1 Tax=Prauserella oleivorans TaxID=1478153 RepID=A0ABW5WG83_9PSEU
MTQPPYPPHQQEALPGCWWHPNRQTGLRCVRCNRPACPDCLRDAPVGYQCVDCVHAGARESRVRRPAFRGSRTVAGAPVSTRAVVTPLLIAVNVLVYLVTAAQAGEMMQNQRSEVFFDGMLWPLRVVVTDEWWRLLTSGFLHYGLLHLAMNMLALWILGRDLEVLLGKIRFLALYLVSLLGGSTAVFVFGDLTSAVAGASGAVYGLMGALLVAVLRLKLNPSSAIGIIVLNLVLTVTIPGISLLGHLGGLIIGALAMVAMVYAPAKQRTAYQVGTLVFLTLAMVGLIVYRDGAAVAEACAIPGVCLGVA